MDVPTIGKAKGLFEIFIPGVFLLLNFVWMLYCIQWNVPNLESVVKNDILMLVLVIVFGYLIGAILYLGDADYPDKYSAKLRNSKKLVRFLGSAPEEFYRDEFPYIKSFESIAQKYLPGHANLFYSNCWKPRGCSKNKYFFNYCKALINAVDEKSALENYSNESLIMYLAAMFYALVISILLLVFVLIVQVYHWIIHEGVSTFVFDDYRIVDSFILIIFYIISIFILLWHFRYMRFKEVQTVFTASLINRESIETCFKEDRLCDRIFDYI